jgi:uncharacterized OB-fold protein
MTATDLLPIVLKFGGDPADLPFWEGCRDDRFLLHRCDRCGRHYWPASRCVEHGGEAMSWVEATGRGTLHTYTVMHRAYLPAMKEQVPYAVAVVQLEEGPFFHANLIDCPLEAIEVGMPLEAVMTANYSGLICPQFRPRDR